MTQHDSPAERLPLSRWALVSCTLGMLGLLAVTPLFNPYLGGILAILAVIAAHAAHRETKRGLRRGRTLALYSTLLGYSLLVVVIAVMSVRN